MRRVTARDGSAQGSALGRVLVDLYVAPSAWVGPGWIRLPL